MYLSELRLWNFRKFGRPGEVNLSQPDLVLPLKNGLNVLIGENDAGKSAIIDAIRFALGTHSSDWNRINEEDFHKGTKRLRIELTFSSLSAEEGKNFIEWLSFVEDPRSGNTTQLKVNYDVSLVKGRIMPADLKAGADENGHPLNAVAREYLKTTYLRPLRDAKAELVAKKNSRFAQILLGHELFKGKEQTHQLKKNFDDFNKAIEAYFEAEAASGKTAEGNALKVEIDRYLASFYGDDRKSVINAAEGSLKAILEKLEISLRDEINPGLGTLNRLFMASELVHLNKQQWHGSRLCLIEELEAHLHPQAQMQVIEALQRETGIQIILTTHSPNLASKVKLDSITICSDSKIFPMGKNTHNNSYSELDAGDHQFLELFLDATKANLFFARGVLLVEGWAEELILPALAKHMKKSGLIKRDLTEARISVVNVGGTSQLRYAKIFARKTQPHFNIPVAVVTDCDIPAWRKTKKAKDPGQDNEKKEEYEYSKRPDQEVEQETAIAITALNKNYDMQCIKSFIAPTWTLEYCLLKSSGLGDTFKDILAKTHPQINISQIESELAQKLISRSLDKTDAAHRLALKLEADALLDKPSLNIATNDTTISYLMEAIKYVCRA